MKIKWLWQGMMGILLGIFSSCVTMTTVVVEFPHAPPNKIPDSIQSLLLVNRIPRRLLSDYKADSLQKEFTGDEYNLHYYLTDKQAADSALVAVGDLLFESGRFDYVIPAQQYLHQPDSLYLSTVPWGELKQLCELYNTDAVLSLDFFMTDLSASIPNERYYDPSSDEYGLFYSGRVEVNYNALLKIFDPFTREEVTSQLLRDTIIWENYGSTMKDVYYGLPVLKNALIESGIYMANKLKEQIAPSWTQEKRKIFKIQATTQGIPSGEETGNQWETVMEEWKSISEGNNSASIRSKAEYNLAVAYELRNDLKQALDWGLKSYNTMYRQVTYNFLLTLKNKKEASGTNKD